MEAHNKYATALKSITFPTDDATVISEVNKILEKKNSYNNAEAYKKLFSCLDLTTLEATDTQMSVTELTERVNRLETDYPHLPHIAAICTYPIFADTVRGSLEVSGVAVDCVAGGFPSSQTFTEVKIAECALAAAGGADELDVVINLGYFLENNYEELCDELTEMRHAVRDARFKVIIETGALPSYEDVRKATVLAMYSDADFVKTSTGKGYPGATPEAVYVMCLAIKAFTEKFDRKVGIKVSGGVRTIDQAMDYYTIVREVLGEEWLDPSLFRIGASSLADTLLSAMEGKEIKHFKP